ncbi:MAG: hypothetical protein AAFV07_03280 [Bacteroidota bacterium]
MQTAQYLMLTIALLLMACTAQAQDPFAGSYQGQYSTLVLQGSNGQYKGHAVSQGIRYEVSAVSQDGQQIQGVSVYQGMQYPWTGTRTGSGLRIWLNGVAYDLQKQGAVAQNSHNGGSMTQGRGAGRGKLSAIGQQWFDALNGAKLTYIYSKYTQGYGGGNAMTTVDLCANGTFHYNSESSVYVPNGGGVGTASKNGISGRWEVVEQNGQVYLYGVANNGQAQHYLLEYRNNKVFVGGKRYAVERGKAQCW